MSTILAIETSTEMCSVAVLSDTLSESARILAGQEHSEQVLGMVAMVLKRAGLTLADCAAIAFGAGPGSFTGLRIACAVAQGLGWAADLPLVGVSTLAAIAEQCRVESREEFHTGTQVLVAQDARMGEAYWSLLEWDGGNWTEIIGPSLSAPAGLLAVVPPGVPIGCGNAFDRLGTAMAGLVGTIRGPLHPDAAAVAALGRMRFMRSGGVPAAEATPLYVRDRVAQTSAERALATEQHA